MAKRLWRQTEIGDEVQCARCKDYWPADDEFFQMPKGRPHSYCKDCANNSPKNIERRAKLAAITKQKRELKHEKQNTYCIS